MAITSRLQEKTILTAGIGLRIILVCLFVPALQLELFAPFIQSFTAGPSLDPWTNWLHTSGASDAFPYGPLMLGYFALFSWPFTLAAGLQGTQFGIALGLLAAELVVWFAIFRIWKPAKSRALILIAVSPILLIATYVHGQLDLLPAIVLFFSLIALLRNRWGTGGLILGLAVSIKFSALLVLPFIAIFLIRNAKFRPKTGAFLLGLVPGLSLACLPIVSPGYREMVLGTPQVGALLKYSLELGPNLTLLIAPLVVAVFIALIWQFQRANPQMLFAVCAIALSAIPLAMPSSPGWFLWGLIPLILTTSLIAKRYAFLLVALGSLEGLVVLLTHSTGNWRFQDAAVANTFDLPTWILDLVQSSMLLLGAFTLWRITIMSLRAADPYRLTVAPLSVAVAGDSGTGKDTLCASLASVFGESRSAFIFGDDYHSFERGDSAWKAKTHLDPGANDLARLSHDSLKLLSGESVWSRHYDHARGRFTKPRKLSNGDFIAISGLHVLSLSDLLNQVDLTVFLDMDNDLRKYLKVLRDTTERNQSPESVLDSLEARDADRNQFIQPQSQAADVVLALSASSPIPDLLKSDGEKPIVDVTVTLNGFTFGRRLVRSMTSIAGADASETFDGAITKSVLRIPATDWITATDIEAVAHDLIDQPSSIFSSPPTWAAGSHGIAQLIVVLALLEKRTKMAGGKYS